MRRSDTGRGPDVWPRDTAFSSWRSRRVAPRHAFGPVGPDRAWPIDDDHGQSANRDVS